MHDESQKIEINLNGWHAVCNGEGKIEAMFPTENYAFWYLQRHGWSGWEIRQISTDAEGNLFFLEHQNCRADNDQH